MSFDVSGFGLTGTLIASNTYPTGITINQFASDTDALDMNSIDIADLEMGLNGDGIGWEKPVVLPLVIAVIPGSDDDTNLQILFDANRVAQGKNSANDQITFTIVYPNLNSSGGNTQITMLKGKIVSGSTGRSVSSNGKQKTKVYGFKFADKVGG
jgi:hypothetical protein